MTNVSDPPEEALLVTLDWADLVTSSPAVEPALEKAFATPDSTGILAIRNVPHFVQAKKDFLPQAHTLATLPPDYLNEHLTDADSLFNAGWSHGKEKLRDDTPDLAKGSFYFNPVTDLPGTPEDREKYPLSYPQNLWPEIIPGFQVNAKKLGCILKEAVVEVTRHLDALAGARQPEYPEHFLYNAMKDTDKVKARLLYYFPLDSTDTPQKDSWIGWHNDSGFLTALAGDLYINHETGDIVDCPDHSAGLYVATRDGRQLHVSIPEDCLAVQMGECTQIVTGGAVSATPHCVRGAAKQPKIARCSMPCFVDTPPIFQLNIPKGSSREAVLDAAVPYAKVPPLAERWTGNGMAFGDFLTQTFSLYYNWGNKKE